MDEKLLTPQEYFDIVKERKHKVTEEDLVRIYDNCLELIQKYIKTGQVKAAKKLMFHLDSLEKEKDIIKAGVDTFIYRSDIEDYIDNVAKDVVKVIELENYERDIPEEVVEVIEKVKDKFTKMYVIFTDYTGKIERSVEKERREKDPILLGTLQNKATRTIIERFYYIADWVDEYCDLTLDRMVDEMAARGKNISHNVSLPVDIEELKQQLKQLEPTKDDSSLYAMVSVPVKESFFDRIKSIFKK